MARNRAGRGSVRVRLRRRQWLLDNYGDGTTAPCSIRWDQNCAGTVDINTCTIDRWPIPGAQGGRYVEGNIRPACDYCNKHHGTDLSKRMQAKSQRIQFDKWQNEYEYEKQRRKKESQARKWKSGRRRRGGKR